MSTTKQFERNPDDAMIFGVIAGLADYFNLNVTVLRLITIILFFAGFGAVIIAYIALAIFLPAKGRRFESVNKNIEILSDDMKHHKPAQKGVNVAAVILILFGTWLLLRELFPELFSIDWDIVWPAALIALGAAILIKSRK